MAEHKRRVHLALLARSGAGLSRPRLLKTDLFEEALGSDEVLLSWPPGRGPARVAGIDLSGEICRKAGGRLAAGGRSLLLARADARALPFRDGSFDIVFSCSTLDHFERREDLLEGLAEAARVLAPGGELVLTLDNPRALFYPLVKRLERRGLIGFRLGVTLTAGEASEALARLGIEILEERGIYHVPRVVFTALLRAVRGARLRFLGGPLLRLLGALERGAGRRGQYLSAWYVAIRGRKRP
ncbi:MAG: class I SAM-dependent methyltransferase [Candidatus Latescibacterota bacterium]|nr:MAG: class I SAM-dependent methyltransferase [Candidatus Latescibacterota bacterium]